MLQYWISGREKTRLLKQCETEASRWLYFTTVHTGLASKQSPAPKSVTFSGQHPLRGLRYAERQTCAFCLEWTKGFYAYWDANILTHVYTLVELSWNLESALFSSFKYFPSMDFDSSCSWFCSGLDLALSEIIFKLLWSMNTILENLHIVVYTCVRELISTMCKTLRQCCSND